MRFIYEIAIRLFGLSINLISPLNPKVKKLVEARKAIFKILPDFKNKKVIWVHCASLGEYEQASTIIKRILEKNYHILITFSSPSGFENVNLKQDKIYKSYLPLDTKFNMEKFVDRVNPEKVILIKYEFWPNLLLELHRKNIETYSASSTFRDNHFFFKWYGKWNYSVVKKSITHFLVQDENSKINLKKSNIENVIVVGDSRYDKVLQNFHNKTPDSIVEKFKDNKKLIVCGSTWPKDHDLIFKLYKEFPNYKFLIVPHEMKFITQIKYGSLYSKIESKHLKDEQILIVDSIGKLSNLYQYADLCYVGGGFNQGIHNILEGAIFGNNIIFGPNHKKFNEAQQFLKKGFAKSIRTYDEFFEAVTLLENKKNISEIITFCKKNSGSDKKIVDFIFS